MHRRPLLAAFLAAPALARAQGAYPNRAIRMLCGFPPGGTTDIAARLVSERLSARLGVPVTVENRPGATGNIATEALLHTEPDGYSLQTISAAEGAMNYTLFGPRNPSKPEDVVQVGLLMRVPNAIFVHPSLPVHSIAELIAYAKAHPGKLNFGSTSLGGTPHMGLELLKLRTGIDLLHVPFRGAGPMLVEAMAGRVQVGSDNMPSVIGHLRDGRLRAIAVTSAQRSPALPNLPAVAETVPGFEATGWFGVQAPARVPAAIIARLGAEIDAITREQTYRLRLAELGADPPGLTEGGGTTPTSYASFTAAEIGKWGEVIRASGVRLE